VKFSELPIVETLLDLTKKYSLPGFEGIPIYDVVLFIYNESMKDDIITRANSVAFNFFISLFPSLIFLFTLLPLLPVTADYITILKTSTEGILPFQAHNYLFTVVEDVASIKRGGLQSVSFLFAIIFSSSGMVTLMYGFHKSYQRVFKKRSYVKNRFVAILLTLLFVILFIISMLMIIFGKPILELILNKTDMLNHTASINQLLKWVIVTSFLYVGITLIYRYGSAMRRRIKWLNSGAILATSVSIIASVIFAFFINNFGKYNEIYGSIGALLVLLLWIQINALIVLIGFELNASIAVNQARLISKKSKE
jgi:membrane protein